MNIQKILRSLGEKLFPAAASPAVPVLVKKTLPPVKELKLYCLKDPVTKKLQTLTYHMNKCPCGRN
jgi:hypothetical protein